MGGRNNALRAHSIRRRAYVQPGVSWCGGWRCANCSKDRAKAPEHTRWRWIRRNDTRRTGTLYRRSPESLVVEQAADILKHVSTDELVTRIQEMREQLTEYRSDFDVDSPEELDVNQTNQALTEAGSPQDEIGSETIQEGKTLRQNLAFANAALSISNAEQFVDTNRCSTNDNIPAWAIQDAPDRAEPHTLRGATDRPALLTIRDVIKQMEPLATAELDDFLDPSVLEVVLDNGLCGAGEARIDIQWTIQTDYKFHYTDTEWVNLRWGKHPHAGDYNSTWDEICRSCHSDGLFDLRWSP
jgi:hypothetical protein